MKSTRYGREKMKRWISSLLICLLFFLTMFTAAHAEKKIKVGIVGPMKFTVGEEKWWGATMAADEINASGGVLVGGQKYEVDLVMADSNEILSLPDAVNAMERLVNVKNVDFIVGGFRTEAVLAMQEVMADYKKIWIGAAIGGSDVCARLAKNYDRYKYFFRLAVMNPFYTGQIFFKEAEIIAGEIREKLGIAKPRVAIFAEKVLWPEPVIKAAQSKLPQLGMEVVGVWRASPTATDTTAELTAIKNSGAHMMFFISASDLGVVVAKQWGELKIPVASFGVNCESMSDKNWVATRGFCNYEATHNYYGDAAITPKTLPFIKKFKERFKFTPTNQATTYDAIYLFKDAVERAGTLETNAVLAALEKTNYLSTHGKIAFYPKDDPKWPHDIVFGPKYVTTVATQWQDGRQVVIWPDGKAFLGDESWVGVKYAGTGLYKLPPWVTQYWKNRK
jgi:branched-chain amino acid transport system substrate-binding protein